MMIKALCFDMFGTVLDWRNSIITAGREIKPDYDWAGFAKAWSLAYGERLGEVKFWCNLDTMLATAFYDLMPAAWRMWPIEQRLRMATTWERLTPHKDAIPAFKILQRRVKLVAFSNANWSMLSRLCDYSQLFWDDLYSAEAVQAYKPHPSFYTTLAEHLKLEPEEIAIVAAHTFDVNKGHELGFRSVLIEREDEPGSSRKGLEHKPDFIASDLLEFAKQFTGGPMLRLVAD